MRLLSRTLFREIFTSAALGCVLFTIVIYLYISRQLFRFVVENPGPPEMVARLFALVLPQALPYTIPLGVLVGVLLALGRKSADGEITAMRAAGVPGWRVVTPVLAFAVLGMIAAGCSSLWLTPWSIREVYRLQNQLLETQLNAEIQPLFFEERFPNMVLHVRHIDPGTTRLWRQVLLADVSTSQDRGNIPSVTLAQEAIAQPDLKNNRIQLSLRGGLTYESAKDPQQYNISSFPSNDQALDAQRRTRKEATRPSIEMDSGPLYKAAYGDAETDETRRREARVELMQRLVLPIACVALPLAGVPLALSSRRRGKSPAVVLTVVLAFAYYIGLISMISISMQGTLPTEAAMWIPNLAMLLLGIVLLARMERPGRRDYLDVITSLFQRPAQRIAGGGKRLARFEFRRLPLLPQVIDAHIVSRFLFYFFLWLASFILLLDVFTFFELLSDVIRNQIPLATIGSYLFFLTPRWIYELTPVSVLVSVLVVLGVLSKDNEVTAFKACGVSVYRLAAPLLVVSLLLSGALFAFNHYVVPGADRIQNALRAQIKGLPAQTFLNPDKKWIWGMDDRVFYYRHYDSGQNVMADVNVFEIDSAAFQLKRHIFAKTARWEPVLAAWVFQDGWSRDLKGRQVTMLDSFPGQTRVFAEIGERPDYFLKEDIQSAQMNYKELEDYIQELQDGGFDTTVLRVQYFKKFAVPLFAFILALVSAPFGFSTGTRGAMAGVGISFVVYVAYVSVQQLFEQLGNLNQLPPEIAAWSPDAMFSLAGLYFLMRVRS